MKTHLNKVVVFRVGDKVMMHPNTNHTCPEGRVYNKTARIVSFMDQETYKGGVMLDQDLRGCKFWNIKDLVKL